MRERLREMLRERFRLERGRFVAAARRVRSTVALRLRSPGLGPTERRRVPERATCVRVGAGIRGERRIGLGRDGARETG